MNEHTPERLLPFKAKLVFHPRDIVIATDRKGLIVYWNREAEAALGYSLDEVLGQDLRNVCPSRPGNRGPDVEGIVGGQDFAGGIECQAKTGVRVALYLYGTSGRDPKTGERAGAVFVGRDVSGPWRASEEVRSSEEKYRLLFAGSSDGVVVASGEARILEVNDAATRMLGYTAEELRRMHFLDIVPQENRAGAGGVLSGLATAGHTQAAIEVETKAGDRLTLEVSASVMTVHGEGRILAIFRDITERTKSAQDIMESEFKYRTIFESVTDGVLLQAFDGTILDVNRNVCTMLGYTKEELLARRMQDLLPRDARAWLPETTEALLRGGAYRAETTIVRKDRSTFPVEFSASLLQLERRKLVVTLVRDITERKATEQTLRESEEKFRTLAERSPNMVFINVRGKVVYTNERSVELLGYSPEEFYSPEFDFLSVIAPDSRPKILSNFARHMRGEDIEPYEYRLVARGGREMDVLITSRLIEFQGERAILGIVTDITDMKKAGAALQESEARYRTIFESTGTAMLIIEEDTTISLVNSEFEATFGYTRDELIGSSWTRYAHPDDLPLMKDYHRLRRTDAAAVPKSYEFRLLDRQGRVRDCYASIDLVPGTRRAVASIIDISGRKAAEREVKREKERAESYLAVAGVMLVALDQTGKVTLINRKGCEVLGRDRGDIVGLDWVENFVPPRLREAVRDTQLRLVAGEIEPVEYYENPVVAANGDERLIAWHNAVTHDEAGNITGMLGSGEDVTEQRQAEKALADSEASFRALAENANEGIMIVASDPDRLVYANSRMAEIAGRPLDRLYGLAMQDMLPPEWVATIVERRRQRVAGQQMLSQYGMEMIRGDGSRVSVEVAFAYTLWKGQPASLMLVRDISERKAAETALRESEEKYRSVVERASDGICVIQGGRIKYLNRRLAEMAGHTQEELTGGQFAEHLHPDDRAVVADRYRRRLAGETLPPTYKVRILTRSGGTMTIEINAAVSEYEGAPADIVLVRDVTERERVLAELSEARGRYESLLRGMRDGVVTFDLASRITWVNDPIIRLSGLPLEFWQGRHFTDFLPPDQHALFRSRFEAVVGRGEQIEPYEFSFRTPAGQTFHLEANPAAIRAGDKTIGGVLVVRDITARKAADQALRESEERLRGLLEASPDGVAVHQEGRVVMMNPAGARILGYDDPAQVIGMSVPDFLHPDELAQVLDRMRRVVETGPTGTLARARFRRRDGSYVPLEVAKARFDWQGKPAVQVVFRDIATRVQAEENLKESEQRFRSLVDASPDGIVVYQNSKVVIANQACATLLGYDSPDDLVGKPAGQFVNPDDLTIVAERENILQERPPGHAEGPLRVRFRRRDGTWLPTEVVGAMTTWNGAPAVQVMVRVTPAPA